MRRVIWQYWETRGKKPAYIDGLHEIAARNAGVPIIRVTPETLPDYLPDMPREIHGIHQLAHKADMIRALLVRDHGGMWLDSDALVLKDLNGLFDLLDEVEFVGFNDVVPPREGPHVVRVNCFLSRPGGLIVSEWARQQHAKFPRTTYEWTEIGSDILHPLCGLHADRARILPFEWICPVPAFEVKRFNSRWTSRRKIVEMMETCLMVMVTNSAVIYRNLDIQDRTTDELARQDTLLGHFLRRATDPRYVPTPSRLSRILGPLAGVGR